MSNDTSDDATGLDRRTLMKLALGVAGSLSVASGHAEGITAAPGAPTAPAGGAPRPRIAMLVHPKMVLLDLVGPMTTFNVMGSEIHLVWKDRTPVESELRVPITPTTTFAECPRDLDVLFVPGGLAGTIEVMQDSTVVEFLAQAGARAKYVTSVCTGGLLLGAAGLLKGYQATAYWMVRDHLAAFGATVVKKRVVQDRNRMTAGGVTAGIDFGLTLVSRLRDDNAARRDQLMLEYAPEPPFHAGTPEEAGPELTEALLKMRARTLDATREAVAIASRRMPS